MLKYFQIPILAWKMSPVRRALEDMTLTIFGFWHLGSDKQLMIYDRFCIQTNCQKRYQIWCAGSKCARQFSTKRLIKEVIKVVYVSRTSNSLQLIKWQEVWLPWTQIAADDADFMRIVGVKQWSWWWREHQHGGRKVTETSVIEFCHRNEIKLL